MHANLESDPFVPVQMGWHLETSISRCRNDGSCGGSANFPSAGQFTEVLAVLACSQCTLPMAQTIRLQFAFLLVNVAQLLVEVLFHVLTVLLCVCPSLC